MGILGFGVTKIGDDKRAIEDLDKMLRDEIVPVRDFEQQLTQELREIHDLENNFNVVETQIRSIETLAAHRDLIIKILYDETEKRLSEISIEKCREQFQALSKLDSELRPMLDRVYHEMQRLLITETHTLYAKSDKNRNSMHTMDKKVRAMLTKTKILLRNMEGAHPELQRINETVSKLEQERALRPQNSKKMGF